MNKTFIFFIPFLAVAIMLFSPDTPDICAPCDCVITPVPTCTPMTNVAKGTAGLQGGCPGLYALNAAHWYGWGYTGWGDCQNVDRVSMVRDWQQLTAIVSDTVRIDGEYVMLFNEPDKCSDQACLSNEDVILGQAIAEALFHNKFIVSPAYSQDAYTQLETVRDGYIAYYGKSPRWDVLAAHCYFVSDPAPCQEVVDWYIEKAIEWDSSAVWITEFAALAQVGSAGVNWTPAVQAGGDFIDYLESEPMVERYYWYPFGFEPYYNSALIESGELTPLGEMYRSK